MQAETWFSLASNNSLRQGFYRLGGDVAGHLNGCDCTLPEPNCLNWVSLDFGVVTVEEHYHVAL